MTESSSEADQQTTEEEAPEEEAGPLADYARRVAEVVGGERWSADHDTVKVHLRPERWVEAIRTARDELELVFFSFLSAIDWSHEVEVGDPPEETEHLEERLEVFCRLSDLTEGNGVIFAVDLAREGMAMDTLVGVFPGANWHERECHEMFGVDFRGHPNLIKLYLPDSFEGHPLRKSFPLLTREVKPWPGKVDVEDMPPDVEEEQRAAYGSGEEEE